MNFGTPNWLWALAVLPLLVLLYARAERRSAITLREFVSRHDCSRSSPAMSIGRGARFVLLWFCSPSRSRLSRWPNRAGATPYKDVKRRGLDLLLAVDTSRSMLSNDVAPNRLERVKLAVRRIRSQSCKAIAPASIAFAGRAFLQAPLRVDYDAAVESMNNLDTKTIREGGTNISEAIALATQTFGKSAMGKRALIIFTDGEELSGDAVTEAKKAADVGVRIVTVKSRDSAGLVNSPRGEERNWFREKPRRARW